MLENDIYWDMKISDMKDRRDEALVEFEQNIKQMGKLVSKNKKLYKIRKECIEQIKMYEDFKSNEQIQELINDRGLA